VGNLHPSRMADTLYSKPNPVVNEPDSEEDVVERVDVRLRVEDLELLEVGTPREKT
jgi:hypothetical protein